MKFNEMTYTRPDIGALLARCKELAAKAAAAPDGDALVRLYYEQSEAFAEYNTAANLANIHYTCDTRDACWKAEQDFFDANGPAVSNASVEISRAFLANPHVDALTEVLLISSFRATRCCTNSGVTCWKRTLSTRLKYVLLYLVTPTLVYVRTATVVTWRVATSSTRVKQSVLSRHSPSVNRVHS